MKVCAFPGCDHKAHAKGYCLTHYAQVRRGKGLKPSRGPGLSFMEWLANSSRMTETGCLEWVGPCNPDGYGQTSVNGKRVKVHRHVWELANGLIPEGLFVCHTCDNRKCFNLAHLFLGTVQVNNDDMVRKGRQASVLGAKDVLEIREDYRTYQDSRILAVTYGISEGHIKRIVSNRYWRHLTTSFRQDKGCEPKTESD